MGVKAIIMAGGEGTRLRPLTVYRPKPMVSLVNRPLIEYLIYLLRKHGFREIGVTLHYIPESIMRYFGDGSRWGVKLYYSIESGKPLGTAGGVKYLIEKYGWNDTLIILSGDVFTNINLSELIRFHHENNSYFTIALRRVDDPTKYGIALLNKENRVIRFMEKPSWSQVFSDLANMGIYVVEPDVFKYIPSGEEYDFAKNLIPQLINNDLPVHGFRADQYYWSDIGDLDQYKETHQAILSGKVNIDQEILGKQIIDGVYIGRDVEIDDLDKISPPVVIGDETRIKSNTTISPYTVIGSYNIIEGNTTIEKSIIWNHNYIGYSSRIIDSIIADHVYINEHATIMEGSVIGDETRIGKGVVVKPHIRIWPSKIIEPYTIVSMNIKWGIRWYKSLIGPWGITGLVNVEITPELATRIGMSIGSIVSKYGRVAIARDTYISSRMVKHALLSGLLSTGVKVVDLGVSPLPVLTNYISSKNLSLGIMVNTLVYDPSRVRVKIFDKNGKFISREYVNRIENIFFREAYRKVLGDETGDIENPNDHYDLYIDKILKFIDLEKIAETRFLVDCCYGASSSLWNRLIKQYHLMIYQANCTEASSIPPHREPMIHQSIDSATKIIPTLKLDGGFIFDSDGDKVVVVSDRGNILSSEQLIALMSKILIEKIGSGKVALPHTFPRNIIEYIEELGGQIVFVEQGLIGLSKYLDKDLLLAADERGGIIYPWIHGGADAVLTTLFILEYLRENNLLLSTLIKELPVSLVVKDKVIVPFDKRGLFMRLIYEELREKEVDTLDGIKIIEEDLGWGYIRLIPNEPVVEFIAGSDSIDKADKLLKILREIADKILSKI